MSAKTPKILDRLLVEIDLELLGIDLHEIDAFVERHADRLEASLTGRAVEIGGTFRIPEARIVGRVLHTSPRLAASEVGVCQGCVRVVRARAVGCGYISLYLYMEVSPAPGPRVQCPALEPMLPPQAFFDRPPAFVVFAIANTCNLVCRHCYYYQGAPPKGGGLTDEQRRGVLRAVADAGIELLSLSGGEPLLVKGLEGLLHHAKDLGLRVILNSNLTLMTEKRADAMRACAVDLVITSLESAEPAVHDALRGRRSFSRTVAGIRRCVERGLQVGINVAVTALNRRGLPALMEVASDMGVAFVKFEALIPRGRAVENWASLAPEAEEYPAIAREIDVLCERFRGRLPTIVSNVFERLVSDGVAYSCPSGDLFVTVAHDGKLSMCPSLIGVRASAASALEISFLRHREEWGRIERSSDVACRSCADFQVCRSGCFARSQWAKGDPFSRDPLCDQFGPPSRPVLGTGAPPSHGAGARARGTA